MSSKESQRRSKQNAYMIEQKCPVCGSSFVMMSPGQWVYKVNGRHVCSWKCVRTAERRNELDVLECKKINEFDIELN